MQRILIVSDTHKRLGNLYEALEKMTSNCVESVSKSQVASNA